MSDHSAPLDRRLDRRIPVACPATLKPARGEAVRGECVDLSVGGMTLRAAYVPSAAEVLEVVVASPQGALSRPPLVARVEVRRCHALGDGVYEIGGAIVEVVD